MLTSSSNRSPLSYHFSFQANVAIFFVLQCRTLFAHTQVGDHGHPRASARARCSLWCPSYLTYKKTNVDFEILSAIAK